MCNFRHRATLSIQTHGFYQGLRLTVAIPPSPTPNMQPRSAQVSIISNKPKLLLSNKLLVNFHVVLFWFYGVPWRNKAG